jgi:two-component system chemotaxis response regulator CheY
MFKAFMVKSLLRNISAPGRPRILVADDSIIARRMVLFALQGLDYDLIEVENGAEALALLQTTDIDLLITDLYMPRLDGLSLIQELRGAVRTADLPIILLTAETDAQKELAARQAGVSLFMSKPFQPAYLAGLVQQVFA